jgi:VWFA-related protein
MEGDAPMTHRRQAATIALLLPLLLTLSPTVWPDVPKSPESFFESIDINVVNVEVYVTDKHGRPVPGLTRADFELREDGKPVELTNFYAGEGPAVPAAPAAAGLPAATGLPAAPAPEAAAGQPGASLSDQPAITQAVQPAVAPPSDEQRLNLAVFVDNLNLTPAARNRVLGSLKRFFANRLSPRDRVVLASYDGTQVKIRQAPTSDPKALVKTIEELAKGSPRGNHTSMVMRDLFAELGRIQLTAVTGFQRSVAEDRSEAKDFELPQLDQGIYLYSQARFDETRHTLAALTDIVDSLAGLQGRKALLYISGELSLRAGEVLYRARELKFGKGEEPPTNDVDSAPYLRTLVDHANANRVTLYGLGAPQDFGNIVLQVGGVAWAHDLEQVQSDGLAAALHTITDHTGGLTSVDLNDPGVFLERIRNDFGSFYSLGFSPAHQRDGKLHGLAVKVKERSDLKLRYREAYQDRSGEQRMTAATMSALLLGVEENPLGVQLDFDRESSAANGAYMVSVLVKMPISKLVLLPQAKFHEGRVTLFVGTRDGSGRMSKINRMEVPVRIPNEQLQASMGKLAGFRVNLLVRPERQTVAVGVRDDLGHVDSTVRAAFLPGKLGQRLDG